MVYLLLDIAANTPSFLVHKKPSRSPLAHKSLLAPYRIWWDFESIRAGDSEAVDTKGVWFGMAGLLNTDLAYISSEIKWRRC